MIKDGETVKIECLDWHVYFYRCNVVVPKYAHYGYCIFRTGGQITNNDNADDVRNIDLTHIHYLTGPFEIEGAQPGDVLLEEIMDVQVSNDAKSPPDFVWQGDKPLVLLLYGF